MPDRLLPWRLTFESLLMSMPFMEMSGDELGAQIERVEAWNPSHGGYQIAPGMYGMVENRYAPDFDLHSHMREFILCLLNCRADRMTSIISTPLGQRSTQVLHVTQFQSSSPKVLIGETGVAT